MKQRSDNGTDLKHSGVAMMANRIACSTPKVSTTPTEDTKKVGRDL
jgi:hypothetical protein